MSRSPLMNQCGNCSTLFLQPSEVVIAGEVREACPACFSHIFDSILESAVSWMFMHIILHSGIGEARRTNLRELAEGQMGQWEPRYRSL